jgi:phosphohistidine phosphatase
MKTIYFIRHAKSDWSIPGIDDIDRPLNERGYLDAHRMGKHLKKSKPDDFILVSSPAIRALTTALIFAREFDYPQNQILLQADLYEAKIEDYQTVISFLDNKFDTAFIFGHNPTISEAIGIFSNTRETELPTCSVSILRFESRDWSTVISLKGELKSQFSPKSLTE